MRLRDSSGSNHSGVGRGFGLGSNFNIAASPRRQTRPRCCPRHSKPADVTSSSYATPRSTPCEQYVTSSSRSATYLVGAASLRRREAETTP